MRNALLQRNYFPRIPRYADELPPVFATSALTGDLAEAVRQTTARRGGYDTVKCRLARFNATERILEIPHPRPQVALTLHVSDNWPEYEFVQQASPRSRLIPGRRRDGRMFAFDAPTESPQFSDLSARFYVQTDVNAFYSSVYSHALPWALVGRAEAKVRRDPALYFNEFDRLLRATRRNETSGIPIGPGTSAIVGEVILRAVDADMSQRGYSYRRYVDDYQLFSEDRNSAEQFLRDLDQSLRTFRLQLNPRKSSIQDLPLSRTPGWLRNLHHLSRSIEPGSGGDALALIEAAIEFDLMDPGSGAIKFALGRLEQSGALFNRALTTTLLQLATAHSKALPYLARHAISMGRFDLAPYLNTSLRVQGVAGRTDGMSWLLWALHELNLEVDEQSAEQVCASGDCLAMVLLWEDGNPWHRERVRTFVRALLARGDEYEIDEYWLLLYQLRLGSDESVSSWRLDEGLGLLIDEGVSFLDWRRGSQWGPSIGEIDAGELLEDLLDFPVSLYGRQ